MIRQYYLGQVFRGRVQQSFGFETAIQKSEVNEEIYLSFEGLQGDESADRRHHGGPERALHHYPSEHYTYWSKKYGEPAKWKPSGMGENLSSAGMTEDTVCLGDRYQWGEAVIEVSQPRSPCHKLNKRWGIDGLSVDMQGNSRCGWLYRVIQPGAVSANKPLELIERVNHALTILEVCESFFGDPLGKNGLEALKHQNRLSESWKDKVIERLETGKVENWNFRLLGHA
ncbi:MAG: MOSC domain-containing protein [Endozoicomonas sp.]|uniref:MOSC domain-containing protein n=1 Tax=Endozoicomonas sp. TaxID=1892382 RepID=UPI003D9AFB31